MSIITRLQLYLKRHLSPKNKRKLKRYFKPLLRLFRRQTADNQRASHTVNSVTGPASTSAHTDIENLKQGDLVQVKTQEQIQATLDQWNELRGCQFMKAMAEYCGTTQRIFRHVEKFVDERDYRVKKAKGVFLLEGLVCNGTPTYGRCDRACYYFWRGEWLDKIGQ